MLSLSRAIVFGALLPLTLAAPLVTGFTVKQLVQNCTSPLSSPHALLKAYTKYDVQPLEHVKRAALTSKGSVVATPTEYDSTYLSPVQVSPPTESFNMGLDTGSSHISVYAPVYGATNAVVTKTVDIGGAVVTGFVYRKSKEGCFGQLQLRYIDTSEYTGSITYATVITTHGFWEFTSNDYAIGATTFVSLSIDAVVDTGTTLTLLPQSLTKAYYAEVSGAVNSAAEGGFIFPCAATLPQLSLGVGTYQAVILGGDLNYLPVNSTYCYGGVQSNTGIGFSVFGLTFIKSQFVVFRGTSNPTIGFATPTRA
ncbi:Type I transmembrane sorting receptor [Lambiella insularis]|nr:Type I transmembrane sorting receptor [Lambiella insularis]